MTHCAFARERDALAHRAASDSCQHFALDDVSYNDVGNSGGSNLQNWIEQSIANGNPVAIAIPVYPNFDAAMNNPSKDYIDVPAPGTQSRIRSCSASGVAMSSRPQAISVGTRTLRRSA